MFVGSRCIRVDLLSYKSKPTDKQEQYNWRAEKNWTGIGVELLDQFFFLRSSHIRVILQLYESKMTEKQGQYDWRAEKNLDG